MLRPRIIPCLLLRDGGLVKTKQFADAKYVGDPLNAIKIFNEKEADEVIVLDMDATTKGHEPNYDLIANLAAECRMPLCYGGGVKRLDQIEKIIGLGVEKVAVSSIAISNPSLIAEASLRFGRQSIIVVIDVKKVGLFKSYEVFTANGRNATGLDPVDFVRQLASLGVGEIVVNSIDHDGMMKGYDLKLAKCIRQATETPMSMIGGAGNYTDLKALFRTCGRVGAVAGSLFVFRGKYRAVLIHYPTFQERELLVSEHENFKVMSDE